MTSQGKSASPGAHLPDSTRDPRVVELSGTAIRHSSDSASERETSSADSGYVSRDTTPGELKSGSTKAEELNEEVLGHRGLFGRRPTKMKRFKLRAPKTYRDRHKDLKEIFDQKLADKLAKKRKLNVRPLDIGLEVLGHDENDARPCILVTCNKSILKYVEQFFDKQWVKQELDPDPSLDFPKFDLYIKAIPCKFKAFEIFEVYSRVQAVDFVETVSNGHAIYAQNEETWKKATIGGFIEVISTTGETNVFGLTAGHFAAAWDTSGYMSETSSSASGSSDDERSSQDTDRQSRGSDSSHDIDLIDIITTGSQKEPSTDTSNVVDDVEISEKSGLNQMGFGIRFNRTETCSVALDYALIMVSGPKKGNDHLLALAPDRVSDNLADEKDEDYRNVLLLNSPDCYVTGTLELSMSSLQLTNSEGFITTHKLELDHNESFMPGDSGAWVVDAKTNEVYGHIVAVDLFGRAHVIPFPKVLDDVKAQFNAQYVQLARRSTDTSAPTMLETSDNSQAHGLVSATSAISPEVLLRDTEKLSNHSSGGETARSRFPIRVDSSSTLSVPVNRSLLNSISISSSDSREQQPEGSPNTPKWSWQALDTQSQTQARPPSASSYRSRSFTKDGPAYESANPKEATVKWLMNKRTTSESPHISTAASAEDPPHKPLEEADADTAGQHRYTDVTLVSKDVEIAADNDKNISDVVENISEVDGLTPLDVSYWHPISSPSITSKVDNESHNGGTIEFTDARGRHLSFPYERCLTWLGMRDIIEEAAERYGEMTPDIRHGKYDLQLKSGKTVIPDLWEATVYPSISIQMRMWDPDAVLSYLREDLRRKPNYSRWKSDRKWTSEPQILGGEVDIKKAARPYARPYRDRRESKGRKSTNAARLSRYKKKWPAVKGILERVSSASPVANSGSVSDGDEMSNASSSDIMSLDSDSNPNKAKMQRLLKRVNEAEAQAKQATIRAEKAEGDLARAREDAGIQREFRQLELKKIETRYERSTDDLEKAEEALSQQKAVTKDVAATMEDLRWRLDREQYEQRRRNGQILLFGPLSNEVTVPLDACKTWKDVKRIVSRLLRSIYDAEDDDEWFDLVDPRAGTILPEFWPAMVEPGWQIQIVPWPNKAMKTTKEPGDKLFSIDPRKDRENADSLTILSRPKSPDSELISPSLADKTIRDLEKELKSSIAYANKNAAAHASSTGNTIVWKVGVSGVIISLTISFIQICLAGSALLFGEKDFFYQPHPLTSVWVGGISGVCIIVSAYVFLVSRAFRASSRSTSSHD